MGEVSAALLFAQRGKGNGKDGLGLGLRDGLNQRGHRFLALFIGMHNIGSGMGRLARDSLKESIGGRSMQT